MMIWLMLLKLFLVLPLLLVFFWPLIDAYQASADFDSFAQAEFIQLLFTAKGVACLLAGILLHLILIIVGIPVTVRRYHDLNMSGWWIVWFWLLGFIPVVGWISWIVSFVMLYFFDGTPRPNDFGSDPKGRGEQPRHPVVQSRQRPRVFIKTVPTPVSPQTRLSNLEQMLEKGLISEEEYEKKRSSILEQI